MRTGGLLLGLLLAGCGGAGPLPDGGARDGAALPDLGGALDAAGSTDLATLQDMAFVTAPHLPFPQVTDHAMGVLASPQLVTITFADSPFRDRLEQFGDFLIGSKWLATVGAEYGVRAATHQKVRLTDKAPAMITGDQIVAWLQQQAGAALPAPSATDTALVYLLYYPGTTKIDDAGTAVCSAVEYAYHDHGSTTGGSFGFAVLPDCTGKLDDLTSNASHEIIEAATDPINGVYLDVGADDPWSGLDGSEVADLCEDWGNVGEGGFALQRSWSNAAARAGDPCVPVPAGEVLLDVTPSPPQVPTVAAGSSTTFTLTGWSSAPAPAWPLVVSAADGADFDPMGKLSASTIDNGGTVTLTLSVPAGTASGSVAAVQVYSGASGGSYMPVTIVAQ